MYKREDNDSQKPADSDEKDYGIEKKKQNTKPWAWALFSKSFGMSSHSYHALLSKLSKITTKEWMTIGDFYKKLPYIIKNRGNYSCVNS